MLKFQVSLDNKKVLLIFAASTINNMKYANIVTTTGGIFYGWVGITVDTKKWVTLYNTNQVNDGVKHMVKQKYIVTINFNVKEP